MNQKLLLKEGALVHSVKSAEKKVRREGIEFVTACVFIEAKFTKPDCTCRKLCMSQFSVEEKAN